MGFEVQRFPNGEAESELICSICTGVLEKTFRDILSVFVLWRMYTSMVVKMQKLPSMPQGRCKRKFTASITSLKKYFEKAKNTL